MLRMVDGLRGFLSHGTQSIHDHASTGNVGSQADRDLDKCPKIMMLWKGGVLAIRKNCNLLDSCRLSEEINSLNKLLSTNMAAPHLLQKQ